MEKRENDVKHQITISKWMDIKANVLMHKRGSGTFRSLVETLICEEFDRLKKKRLI